jgi:GAF domain-containing protein
MLEERVAARTRELSALYDVTAVASASLDLETVLEQSLNRVLEVMGCTTGGIHLWDEAHEAFQLAVWRGVPAEISEASAGLVRGSSLVDWVINQGELLVVTDAAQDAVAFPSADQWPRAHAYVGAPIHAKGQVLGVLSVIGAPGRQFSAEEVALLASIADQVGVAVENARLYQRTEQVAVLEERERLARELHDSVTQSLYSSNLIVETAPREAEAGDLQLTEQALVVAACPFRFLHLVGIAAEQEEKAAGKEGHDQGKGPTSCIGG